MALPFDKRDARRKQRAEARKPRILSRIAALFGVVIMPADGTSAATEGNGDFGTSPIFGQLSDKPQLACVL